MCLWLTFIFDFSVYTVGEEHVVFNVFGFADKANGAISWFPYSAIIAIAASVCIISIFQFKKRSNQLFIGKIMYLLVLLILGFLFYDAFEISSTLANQKVDVTIVYSAGLFLTVASLPFIFLANRAIKKDDKAIRDADRLR